MKKVEFTKKEKRSLIGIYKACKSACSFDMMPRKSFKDPYSNFKLRVDEKIAKL